MKPWVPDEGSDRRSVVTSAERCSRSPWTWLAWLDLGGFVVRSPSPLGQGDEYGVYSVARLLMRL